MSEDAAFSPEQVAHFVSVTRIFLCRFGYESAVKQRYSANFSCSVD
jgi:hypothetical protein